MIHEALFPVIYPPGSPSYISHEHCGVILRDDVSFAHWLRANFAVKPAAETMETNKVSTRKQKEEEERTEPEQGA